MTLDSREAVNLGSNDLVYGNSEKGLSTGLLTDEINTYRLEVTGDTDVEVVTFVKVC